MRIPRSPPPAGRVPERARHARAVRDRWRGCWSGCCSATSASGRRRSSTSATSPPAGRSSTSCATARRSTTCWSTPCCCARGCRSRASRPACRPSGSGRSATCCAGSSAAGGRARRDTRRARALVAQGTPVLLFMRSQSVAGRRRRALAAARLGPQYLRDVVRAGTGGGSRPVFLVPVAIFRGKGFRRKESRFATLLYSVQEAPGEAKRLFTYLWNAEETQLTLGREIVLEEFVEEYHPRGRGAARPPAGARPPDLPLPRGAAGVGADAAAAARGPRARCCATPSSPGWCAAWPNERGAAAPRGCGRRRAATSTRWPPTSTASTSASSRCSSTASCRACSPGSRSVGLEKVIECVKQHPVVLVPVPPEPLRLPDPLLHLPHELPVAAAHRRRHQPELLADGAALPRRGRVLHPPQLRRQRALQDGLPEVPHLPDPRGLHAGVLHRGRADAHRQDPDAEARHAVGDRRTPSPRACGATSTSCRSRSTTAASRKRRRTGARWRGGEKEPESLGALLRARQRPVAERRYGTVYVSFGEPISLHQALGPQPRAVPGRRRRPGGRGGAAALHPAARLPPAARGERRGGGGRDRDQRHRAPRARRAPPAASATSSPRRTRWSGSCAPPTCA